jgi:MerR family transcriptional regulator, heat shock protein HspR
MNETSYTRIIIRSSQPTAHYSEQETAEQSHMEVQVIRRLRSLGLIQGMNVAGEDPRYSEEDLLLLRRIRRLRHDLGVNLAGVEVILHLHRQLEELRRELEEYKGK